MANAKRLTLAKGADSGGWTFYPPSADLPAKTYSAQLRRDALRYVKRPEVAYSDYTGTVQPGTDYRGTGDGYILRLGCMVGGGWGRHSRETVAEWAGGKRWILCEANGYSRRQTLAKLELPEDDGRLLLIGAPARPAKGVVKWRNRWTVSRGQVAGLVAVAGEGIDPASMRARLVEEIASLRTQTVYTRADLDTRETEVAEALAALPAAKTRGERVMHLLELAGVTDQSYDGTIARAGRNVSQVADALKRRQGRDGHGKIQVRAAAMLERFAAEDARPLAVGVRATCIDGTPMHRSGPFQEAHKVGLPATAPDWNPEARCGNGLHYVPLVQGTDSQWRDGPSCVSDALRYAHGDYALWVVRAEVGRYPDGAPVLDQPPTAVMIDGHKAKARTLTPLARCGKSAAGRAHAALSAWAHAQWQADTAAHRETDTRASLASLERRLAATETTLREWRRG